MRSLIGNILGVVLTFGGAYLAIDSLLSSEPLRIMTVLIGFLAVCVGILVLIINNQKYG